MNHPTDEAGCGAGLCLARNGIGCVTACGCGAVTLTVQCLSLRLDPDAFRELAELLGRARPRLDAAAGGPAPARTGADDEASTTARAHAAPLH